MTRLLILGSLMCVLGAPLMAAVPIPATDVVIIVDESLSMILPPHGSWLKDMVQALEVDYLAAGVGTQPGLPNRYALIGYGSLWPGHGTGQAAHAHGGWMNAASMVANINTLVTFGLKEDGYQAISLAMTLTFRPGAYKTVILVTNEDRDSIVSLSRAQVCQMLQIQDATLNVIVNADFDAPSSSTVLGVKWNGTAYIPTGGGHYITAPGGYFDTGFGTTKVDYVELSWATCGSAWDVGYASNWKCEGESMIDAFTDVKVQELIPVVETIGGQSCADWILGIGCLRYSGGQDCWFWFEYRELGSLVWLQSPKTFPAPGEGLFFMQTIGGLQPDTWYQIRAWVENAVMQAVGSQIWNIQTRPADTTCSGAGPADSIHGCGTDCGCCVTTPREDGFPG